MPAVLHELRDLDAARARGEIAEDEYKLRRDRAMLSIEDAEVAPTAAPPPRPPRRTTSAPRSAANVDTGAWASMAAILVAFVTLTLLAAVVLRDLTLALTLSVTLLAAVVVKAFKGLDP